MAKYTRSMVIMAAINVVFNTQRIFAAGKPFEMKDMLEIEPYLACDEEIAMFCFSSLSNMFVDPAQAKPVLGFVRQMCHYPPSAGDIAKADEFNSAPATIPPAPLRTTHWRVVFKKVGDSPIDYNYVMIKGIIPSRQAHKTHDDALAEAISRCVVRGDHSTSLENLVGIIKTLRESRMMAKPYIGESQKGEEECSFEHILVDLGLNNVYVSRHFIDMASKPEFQDIAINAYREYEHQHIERRRVITGLTYVNNPGPDNKIIAPHIWRCIELIPQNRPLRLANSLGFNLIDGATSSGVLQANRSIEETEFVRFIAEDCCYSLEEQERVLRALPATMRADMRAGGAPSSMSYPEEVLAAYIAHEKSMSAKLALSGVCDEGDSYDRTLHPSSTHWLEVVDSESKRLRGE